MKWKSLLAIPLLAGMAIVNGATAQEVAAEAPTSPSSHSSLGWFGVGLKLGVAGYTSVKEYETDENLRLTHDGHAGLLLSLPLHLGGEGFSWVVDPYFKFASVEGNLGTDKSPVLGLYTGPSYVFRVSDTYLGVSVGPKVGLAIGESAVGDETLGRAAVSGFHYVLDDLGLMAEVGVAAGRFGAWLVGAGNVLAIDASVGVRWQ